MTSAFQNRKLTYLLLRWFQTHRRTLPWRETKDPYKIWISEIMLQQTQVKTVIPYYQNWMKNFPGLHRLARAPLPRVLKSWEGLGYYSRARNLHRTAKIVLKKWNGKLPDSREELEKLPGIGRYTAGAIASIAFNRPEPVLDGNVKRVLARVFAVKEPIDTPRGEKALWEISANCVQSLQGGRGGSRTAPTPRHDYGDFNQSLMELGALVCHPENPKCGACPLDKICLAHRLGRETDFPVKARREKLKKLKTVAAVIWKNGRVLLERQPLNARWGGLWMFPQWIHKNGGREAEFLAEKVERELGITVDKFRPKAEIRHGFTKYRVRLNVYEGRFDRAVIAGSPAMTRWAAPKKLSAFPLPSPHQKIAEALEDHA